MISRRSLFASIFALPAAVPAALAVITAKPTERAVHPTYRSWSSPLPIPAGELIHASMRMIGVIAAGETLSAYEAKAGLAALNMLLPVPVEKLGDSIFLSAAHVRSIKYLLAEDLSFEYGVLHFRRMAAETIERAPRAPLVLA